MKKTLAFLLFLCCLVRADVLLQHPSSQKDFGEKSRVRVTEDGIARGADRLVPCLGKVEIDPTARYRLSVEYKKAEDCQAPVANGMLSTLQYDVRDRPIGGIQNGFLPGSEAKVLKSIVRGDKTLEIEPNAAWCDIIRKNLKRSFAVFLFAKRDFSDMPNFSFCWIKSQKLEDGKIILAADNFPAVPEGSLVRLHINGWVGNGVELKATDQWQTASGEIQGFSAKAHLRHWWKGAAKCSLAIYGKDILFRNLKLEKIEE